MKKTTLKELLLKALKETGEKPEDLVCFWQEVDPQYGWVKVGAPILQGSFDQIPDREFDAGYGSQEGDVLIAFGPKYVYVKVVYDGAETIKPIPRHPDSVDWEKRPPYIGSSSEQTTSPEFDGKHEGPQGALLIAFDPQYIHVKVVHEGAEWFVPIPRHPTPEDWGGEIPYICLLSPREVKYVNPS